ncbi:hypothetical protein TDB9533_02392 [Thalassocella blandensis]|nr:hypothetical protein TDB9533_02392 [Thalassocella blandensis]
MFLDNSFFAQRKCSSRLPSQSESGFLIPLALFILVGLGALAIAINRMSSQSNTAYTLEGVSLQAFYAAETGAQFAMNVLVFDVEQRASSDTNCAAMPGSMESFPSASAVSFQTCSVAISCQRNTVTGNPTSFYIITSTATCGAGNFVSERTVEVSAYL